MNEATIIMRIYKDSSLLSPEKLVNKYRGVLQEYVFESVDKRNNYCKINFGGNYSDILNDLLDDICNVFGITKEQISALNRKREILVPRQMYCFVAKKLNITTLKNIGKEIRDRDHTTVLHSVYTMKNMLITCDPEYLVYWSKWINLGKDIYTDPFKLIDTSKIEVPETPVILMKPETVYNNIPVYAYPD